MAERDLVERLRERADAQDSAMQGAQLLLTQDGTFPVFPSALDYEAATEIESLREQVRMLREVVRPFAEQYKASISHHTVQQEDRPLHYLRAGDFLTLGDLRRARQAYEKTGG